MLLLSRVLGIVAVDSVDEAAEPDDDADEVVELVRIRPFKSVSELFEGISLGRLKSVVCIGL